MRWRRRFLALSAQKLAHKQLGAGTFEGHRQPLVFVHGGLRGGGGRVEVAGGGQQHGSAAGADGQHPGSVEPAAVSSRRSISASASARRPSAIMASTASGMNEAEMISAP